MLAKLEAFAALLRKNRLRVSVAEVCDAVEAARLVGLEHGDDLRLALGAALVKRSGDRSTFDELYDLFFLASGNLARAFAGAPLVELLTGLGLSEDAIERILAVLADRVHELGAAARSALGLRAASVVDLLRLTGATTANMRFVSPLHVGYHTHQLLSALGIPGAERDLERLIEAVRQSMADETAQIFAQAVTRNLDALRQAIRRHVKEELERQNRDLLGDLRRRTLSEKPFAQLGDDEIQKLRIEVRRLAQKLRTQTSLRPRVRRRGRLDLRRTLRRSLATGGIPMELRRRHRRKDRPRLVILCDISDSVRHVSRFMLELVYTLQELFARVRSFVFVSDLGEATPLFALHDLDQAVELALSGRVISVHANSNYGHALEVFTTRYLEAVTSRTTVLVIGDARNNYNPPNAEPLGEIRRRAKQLLWLNPELPGAWGFGDSAMNDYAPHCSRVIVAYNLESLRKVLDDLVL